MMDYELFQKVVDFTDTETWEHFIQQKAKGSKEAIAYLAQWDCGEDIEEPESLMHILQNLSYVNYILEDNYLALWQTGLTDISLYVVCVS